ncbi:MAG: wax ester/triacylglycerol synthase family O-acyltransferase [Pseudomonadales bacterium]|nr:wax ester/triacylglycerol synthase family O-acyltransferase [Pseudomonadales bacterium]
MQQLSELDASFLYLENDHSPMHIGGLYVFDATGREIPFSYEEFERFIEDRLHMASFFRKRLVEVPLKLDHPYWVDDPEFDLGKHMVHTTLDAPDSRDKLNQLACDILKKPLKRDRPLWEVTYLDGLETIPDLPAKSFALVVKIHHAAIDAFSGEDIMGTLLDFSPTPKPVTPSSQWQPDPLPSTMRLLSSAYSSALQTPFRLANMAKETAASTFYSVLLQRLNNLNLPPSLFSAPSTPINKAISDERSIGFFDIPLERIKALKFAIGHDVTINDVVCGICAEALRSYLSRRDALPDSALLAMTPISIRSTNLQSPTGSNVAAMMLSLATDESNPAWRVIRIHDNAVISKTYSQAISAQRLTHVIPSTMTGLAARIYTEFLLAQKHKPIFNVPLTNIPGPQSPLYLNGCKLVDQIGTSPLFDGLGLSVVAISYNGKITFSLTTCPKLIPDVNELLLDFQAALLAIEEASEGLEQQTIPGYEPYHPPSSSLVDMGSALILDVLSLFQNLFSFSKSDNANPLPDTSISDKPKPNKSK